MNTVNPKDIADDAVVLDVREQDEYDAGHAPRAIHIPLGDLPNRLNELPEVDGDLPVVCRSGARSGRAVEWLTGQGRAVANVETDRLSVRAALRRPRNAQAEPAYWPVWKAKQSSGAIASSSSRSCGPSGH